MRFVSFLWFLGFLSTVLGQSGINPTRAYSHREDLAGQGNKFILYWEPGDDSIVFELHARTQGWVGFGVSRQGGMDDTDIALGWVKDDGTAVLQDRYSRSSGTPTTDAQQDLTLISGTKTGSYVILVFSRPLKACDDQDVAIEHMNMKLVWAMGSDIPADGGDPVKHRNDDRGSKTVLLLSAPETEVHKLPDDATSINLMGTNVGVRKDRYDSYYVYKKIPTFSRTKHLIMWEPLIQPGNEDIVHHYVGYLGYNTSDDAPDSWQGFKENRPSSISLSNIILTWSVGGGRVWLPDDVGIAIGGPDTANHKLEYLGLEIMYHNTELTTGRRDSSGIRLWLTETLRQNEAGMMYVGAGFSETNFVVPPRSANFIIDGHCPGECIGQGLNGASQVTVPMVMLHGHMAGSSFLVRHVRNGMELPPITQEKYHDTEFQEFRLLPEPVTVRSTDDIIVECGFDTSKRNKITWGVDDLEDEMCLAIILYYPNTGLQSCLSNPSDKQLLKFLNLDVASGRVTTQGKYNGQTPTQVLNEQDWDDQDVKERFQSGTREGEMRISCGMHGYNTPSLPVNGKYRTLSLPSTPYSPATSNDCSKNPGPSTSVGYTSHVTSRDILFMCLISTYKTLFMI